MFASVDFLQQSVSHFGRLHTYDTVHGEAVNNKKQKSYARCSVVRVRLRIGTVVLNDCRIISHNCHYIVKLTINTGSGVDGRWVGAAGRSLVNGCGWVRPVVRPVRPWVGGTLCDSRSDCTK